MDLYSLYDAVVDLQPHLLRRLQLDPKDFRATKALAACYELQEYLAHILPELPEGEDDPLAPLMYELGARLGAEALSELEQE